MAKSNVIYSVFKIIFLTAGWFATNHTTPTSDARNTIYLRRTLPDPASIQLSYKSILSFNHALLHSLRMDILYPKHIGGMKTVCFMF
jgi:hypothetical protein